MLGMDVCEFGGQLLELMWLTVCYRGIMADKEAEKPVGEEEETDLNYQPPAQKSLQEIQELDKEDESLNKYKQALLGAGPVIAVHSGTGTLISPQWHRDSDQSTVAQGLRSDHSGTGTPIRPQWHRDSDQTTVAQGLRSDHSGTGTPIRPQWHRDSDQTTVAQGLRSVHSGTGTPISPQWHRDSDQSTVAQGLRSVHSGTGTPISPQWHRDSDQSTVAQGLRSVHSGTGTPISPQWHRDSDQSTVAQGLRSDHSGTGTPISAQWHRDSDQSTVAQGLRSVHSGTRTLIIPQWHRDSNQTTVAQGLRSDHSGTGTPIRPQWHRDSDQCTVAQGLRSDHSGTGTPINPSVPNVQVTRLTLVCDKAPAPITMDLTGDLEALKKQNFVLMEGVDYKVKIHFKVNKEIVSGLKYVHHTYRKGIRVDKAVYMVGSYGPRVEEHEFMTPVEEAPKGMLVRGGYHIKSYFTDDDKTDHLSWEWNLNIKKEWTD
ncbi:UNVERIFIED_CONTAM: hypothetical protein FKN15_034978 [Acipenser sinensis]